MILALVLIAASAAINIGCDYAGIRRGVYIFKPLTTSLIIALAVFSGEPISDSYKAFVLVGLLFSLAGDVFLMLPSEQFVAGLGSFLIAHVFYILAFVTESEAAILWVPLIPLLIFSGGMIAILWLHLGNMKGPVLAYMLVIVIMSWMALSRWMGTDNNSAALAGIGATLFLISDSLLALNRFRKPFAAAQFLVLSTYFAAQTLIALSVS